jgi:hypothetical protein
LRKSTGSHSRISRSMYRTADLVTAGKGCGNG